MTNEPSDRDLPGAGATPMPPSLQRRWDEYRAAWRALAERAQSSEDLDPGDPGLPPTLTSDDLAVIRDSLHVPDDAGQYAPHLERILRRIPDGWGRWISCDAGWYPLVIVCDQGLADLAPSYEVLQVKEKFGGLRYYFSLPEPLPECCREFLAGHPEPPIRSRLGVDEGFRSWREAFDAHEDTAEHRAGWDAQAPEREERAGLSREMHQIVASFEALSQHTCELCGEIGVLRQRRGWWKGREEHRCEKSR